MISSKIVKNMNTVTDGVDDWASRIKEIDSKNVYVGITGTTNGTRGNAKIMAIHEYGDASRNIPERRPIRLSMERNATKYAKRFQQAIDKVLRDEMDVDTALKSIGEEAAGDVKITVMQGLTPPLAPSTIRARKKNSDTPLYDTGELVNSITYEVRKK